MVRERLKTGLLKLYQYFRLTSLPTSEQIDLWHEDLNWIPDTTLDAIFKVLKENDSVPRNIPKAIKAAYRQCKGNTRILSGYDPVNDPNYPISYLWTALDVLESKGEAAFAEYCQRYQMPTQDIERVRNKFNCVHTTSELKIGDILKSIPKSPKTYQGPRPKYENN